MNRIASAIVMHARDRVTWFVLPWSVLGSFFAVALFIVLLRIGANLRGPIYTPGLAGIYIIMLVGGISTVGGTFPFAVGFGTRRRDYLLGTVAMAGAVSAAWAIPLVLLSLIEAKGIKNWAVDLHFFHLPYFSDGSPLQQFWVSFALLLAMCLLGMLLGSIYYRSGRTGIYIALGIAFLLLSLFVVVSSYWSWWGAIFGWLAQQTAAGLAWWLVPLMALSALASYALLRKATV